MQLEEFATGMYVGKCDQCSRELTHYRGEGDFDCRCGAIYNAFGQRLRDDLYSRPNYSELDEALDDLEGYEQAMIRAEWEG